MLGRFRSSSGVDHYRAIKKVMRYLQGTKGYMLIYRRIDNLEVMATLMQTLLAMLILEKKTFGYIFMLASGVVSLRSTKQTLIVISTIEVEFVSGFKATLHGVWLKSFITWLRIVDFIYISKPLKLLCDNLAVIFIVKNITNGSGS